MKEVAAVHTYSICFQLFPFKHRLIADKTVSFKILQLRFACLPTKAGGVRSRVDGVAELAGLDQGLAALQYCPLGALPPSPVRALALPEAFEG